jgi:hypothetical protein
MNPLIMQLSLLELSVLAMRLDSPILKNAMLMTLQQIEAISKIQQFLWLSFVELFSDYSDNQRCVIDTYKEYIDSVY